MKKTFVSLLAGGLLLASMSASHAVNTTFVQWGEVTANKPFTYTSAGVGGVGKLDGIDVPVTFSIKNALTGFASGFTGGVGTTLNALLTVHATFDTSTGPAVFGNTPITTLDFTFTANGNQHGIADGTVLLHGSDIGGGSGNLFAPAGGNGGTLGAADPTDTIAYTSDPAAVWTLSGIFNDNYGWGLSGSATGFSYAGTPFVGALNNNTFDMNGTIAADFNAVPEPGVVSLFAGMAICGGTFSLRRRRK
jgi:hypothetical protein